MSKHVSEWLNAYHDGELRSNRLHYVETHLAECELCQAELESLENLSDLLQEVPTPKFTPVERFASQVNLRLPHKQTAVSRRQILEISWWMIPVGLLAVWIFIGTSFFISDILSAANNLGLLRGISDWMAFGPSNDIYLSATLSQLGLLSGNSLRWAESTEAFTRMSLPLISLQISIALLYLSWIAIWWARHTRHQRQQPSQLLEG
jgi:Putative zinc-finger